MIGPGCSSGGAGRALPAAVWLLLGLAGCADGSRDGTIVLTFPGSALGAEGEVLHRQLERFEALNPGVRVVQRRTPDAAEQRHQLYVQWLNAHASDPDILQLDVIWTPEFAAAGWILPLERFEPDEAAFTPASLQADRWRGRLYALPWFVDAGMLYYRTDLVARPPDSFEELERMALEARGTQDVTYGFVWQGARYEGLITVFLEILEGFGGRMVDATGRIAVDEEAAVRALNWMRRAIHDIALSPPAVLTWQEEQVRFAFQNGRAVFMRNWPYAVPLLQDAASSRVAGRFAVAPMPAAAGGRQAAALGGSQLAINARTEHPAAAWRLIDFLTQPEQMKERARLAGQYPPRPALYDDPDLARTLPIPPDLARRLIDSVVARPATPVYTQLSGILQIGLHRSLTGQAEPRQALEAAATEMRALIRQSGLEAAAAAPGTGGGR